LRNDEELLGKEFEILQPLARKAFNDMQAQLNNEGLFPKAVVQIQIV